MQKITFELKIKGEKKPTSARVPHVLPLTAAAAVYSPKKELGGHI